MEHAVVQTDVDRYIIVEYIAEGGMGAIFLGKKVGMGGFEKEVVLKQLLPEFTSQPEFIDLFLREAKLSAALDHANIVHTIDLVAAGNDYFIVMEYVRGGDLRTILRRIKQRGRQIDPAAAIFIAREMLSALAYAHEKKNNDGKPLKLIHRDVSPSNIMVSAAGEVKLADFGIAKASTHKSVFYRVKGKVGYMSPEQAYGESLDHRSDLYSLAVCLHEMLLGERLFVADLLTTPDQIYSQPIPELEGQPDIPRGMDHVMGKALAIDPDDRYQTALEFQDALVQVAFESAMLFASPDLASHLLDVCGPDPSQWNKENEEERDEEHRPGTEVLAGEDRSQPSAERSAERVQFSGVELTSVFTELPEAAGAAEGEATRHVKIDPRGIAFEPTRLQPEAGAGRAARAPAFDLSDSPPAREAPAWAPPAEFSPWPAPSREEDPTVAAAALPVPTAEAPHTGSAYGRIVDRPPVEDSGDGPEIEDASQPDSDATIELRIRKERAAIGSAIPAVARLEGAGLEERLRKKPEAHQMTAKVHAIQAPRHRRLMLITSAVLLTAGGVIAAIVGLTGPSLDESTSLGHSNPPKRRIPDSGPQTSRLSVPDAALSDASFVARALDSAIVDLSPSVSPHSGRGGQLKVDSTPSNAAVLLDGVRQCETPCTVEELEENRVYLLSVQRKNHVSWSSLIDTRVRKRVPVSAYLSEEPDAQRVGYLLVRSTPIAEVYVDGKEIGRVSSEGRIPLPPGQYEISLSHPRRDRRPRFLLTIYSRQTSVLTAKF
jgi:serine/threonine protein kinase